MKVLYFDLEHGSQTLGSEKHIAEMFGYNLLRPGSWDAFQHVIGQLYTKKNTVVEKSVGGLTIKEEQEAITLRDKAPTVDALVVDTFSELSKKYMRSLVKKETGKMMLQDWGKLRHNYLKDVPVQLWGNIIDNYTDPNNHTPHNGWTLLNSATDLLWHKEKPTISSYNQNATIVDGLCRAVA